MANENTGLLIMRLGLAASQLVFAVPRLLRGRPGLGARGQGDSFFQRRLSRPRPWAWPCWRSRSWPAWDCSPAISSA